MVIWHLIAHEPEIPVDVEKLRSTTDWWHEQALPVIHRLYPVLAQVIRGGSSPRRCEWRPAPSAVRRRPT